MLKAIVAGEDNPEQLAALAQGTARKKTAELREALRGRVSDHHRTLLQLHLDIIDALEHTLAELDVALGKALAPIQQRARLLTTIPGVGDLTAQVLLAEIGIDMTRFPMRLTWCPGRACVRAMTKAPASAAAPVCARAVTG